MNIRDKSLDIQESNLYQDFIDISPDLFVYVDRHLDIVDCNIAFCRLNNKSRVYLQNTNFTDYITEESKPNFKKMILAFYNGEDIEDFFKIYLKDFKDRNVKFILKFKVVRDFDNNVLGLFLKLNYFVERTVDSRLQATFSTILNSLGSIYTIISTSLDGNINYVNNAVVDLLGYREEELIDRNIMDIYDTSDSVKYRKVLDMLQALSGKGSYYGEIGHVAKSGEIVPMHLSISNLLHKGKINGRISIGRDLREEKRLEKENNFYSLRLQDQAKLAEFGMMIQGVAHNLNTPLTGILSSTQLLIKKIMKITKDLEASNKLEDKELTRITNLVKNVELINTSGKKMQKIINNMLSKTSQEQSDVIEEINLSKIMEQELEFLMANLFFKNKVEKKYEIDLEIPAINGLYADFSQIFINIIKNALDAMFNAEKKELTIKIYHDKVNIYTEIIDTGKGIPEEIQEKIFQPFFTTKPRINESKDNEPTGTGIGLDNVLSLLNSYQGKLEMDSKVGIGTKFKIIIPISENQTKQ